MEDKVLKSMSFLCLFHVLWKRRMLLPSLTDVIKMEKKTKKNVSKHVEACRKQSEKSLYVKRMSEKYSMLFTPL